VKLFLVDTNEELVRCWQQAFSAFSEVEIYCEDILEVAQNCIVSPGNSYGFMDGGIDLAYYNYFGSQIQIEVQQAITYRSAGFLPVGASILVTTGDRKIPYLIVAPTMEMPGSVRAENCYYAMLAVLQIAHRHCDRLQQVYCPGLGTGVGRVAPQAAAEEMAAAYRNWQERKKISDDRANI
jgi:O-acetyl-ADP-ribose deacetylase (regulator of RNase III)